VLADTAPSSVLTPTINTRNTKAKQCEPVVAESPTSRGTGEHYVLYIRICLLG
jgi:hypothetical protein